MPKCELPIYNIWYSGKTKESMDNSNLMFIKNLDKTINSREKVTILDMEQSLLIPYIFFLNAYPWNVTVVFTLVMLISHEY